MAQTNLNLWEKQIMAKNTKKSPKTKFKIQAEFVRDLEGDHIKDAPYGPSNISPQPIP